MRKSQALKVPEAVTSYFDNKSNAPAFSWLDVWAEEHAYKFTVAKAVELDVLNAFRSTVSDAITTGKGFESWKPLIEKELTKLGWWGPHMVADPTGEQPDRMVNFSSSRRLKTIFWSNMNSARAAGQWERAQRAKKFLPYVLYVRTTSADPRPEHLAWVGLILHIDDPFWKTHWPPNGWGCKCQIRMISEREAQNLLGTEKVMGKRRDGSEIKVRYTDKPADFGPNIRHINRRTGEVSMVPPGIDPGWHTNPGFSRATTLIDNLETRLAAADHADAERVLGELWADPYLKLVKFRPEKIWLPAAHAPKLAETLKAKSPVVSVPSDVIQPRLAKHQMALEDFAILPQIISQGLTFPDIKGNANVRMILFKTGKTIWRAFVSISSNGYLRVNSLHQVREKQIRQQLENIGERYPWD